MVQSWAERLFCQPGQPRIALVRPRKYVGGIQSERGGLRLYERNENKMMELMEQSKIPEGESGDWKVIKYTIDERKAEFFNLRNAINGRSYANIVAGTYTKLTRNGGVVMTDTPMEMDTHAEFVHQAQGYVLMNGLGLGLALQAVIAKPVVNVVMVIELSPDVINLVAPCFNHPKVTIVEGNAFTYKPELPPNGKFDVVWHDIWNEVCVDNYDEMKRLHRRYGHWAKWQGSWSRFLVEDVIKQQKEMRW